MKGFIVWGWGPIAPVGAFYLLFDQVKTRLHAEVTEHTHETLWTASVIRVKAPPRARDRGFLERGCFNNGQITATT